MPTTDPTAQPPALGQTLTRSNLSLFVRQKADETAEELGFCWIGTQQAPSTFPQLRAAFWHSLQTGEPLPVSNEYCEDTIYLRPSDNVAFRFWHDTSHCIKGLSFQLADEWELALWHLDQLTRSGYGPDTPEHELFRIDALGQIILMGIAGRFPFNQGEFVRTCSELGLDAGVMRELGRLT